MAGRTNLKAGLVIWVFLLALGAGERSAVAESPPGCTGDSLMATLAPSNEIFLDGDTIEYTISLYVPPPNCDLNSVDVTFWPPGNPPDNPGDICSSTNGTMIASGLLIAQGAPALFLDSTTQGCSILSYTVNHADADASGNLIARVCIKGRTETSPPVQSQWLRSSSNAVINPEIAMTKEADGDDVCPGTEVTYTYTVTNPGDVDIGNVNVVDSDCSPVMYVSGDSDADGEVDTYETWIYECSTMVSQETTNTATVTGREVLLQTDVIDTAQATVTVPAPGPPQEGCLLANGGFEEDSNIIFDRPNNYGYWAGNYSAIVTASDVITPFEGTRMLQFIHAGYIEEARLSTNCELWQIIDISAYAAQVATGIARANGSAYYNRVTADANTDTEFLIELTAYQGDPCDFDWFSDILAAELSSINSDGDPCTWEAAQTELLLPADTNFLMVRIAAVEDVFNDTEGVEFDGHYADDVCVSIGKVIYVDCNAPGPVRDGNSWPTAFRHLQEALDIAEDGGQIWVAQGTYKPDSNAAYPTGTKDRNATFELVNGVATYGGFPSGGDPNWNDRDAQAHETILSGDINLPGDANDNSYHVVTGSGTEPNTILDGFIITAGNADSPPRNDGGGMYNDGGSPTVTNCMFTGNRASGNGGAMYNENSSPVVAKCRFRRNTVYYWGGGMGNYYGSRPTVFNCTFSGNHAYEWGGGMFNYSGSNSTVVNCTFTGNSADISGGGMLNFDSDPNITNCILWGNYSPPVQVDIRNLGTSSPSVKYCDVQGGYSGPGNINVDPLFVDADGPDDMVGTDDDNLRLSAGSLCVDSGDNNSVVPDSYDLDERPRIADGDCNDTEVVDMGAYEFSYGYIGDFDDDCDVDLPDFGILALAWLSGEGEGRYNAGCDISLPSDQYIDWRDLDILCDNWLAGL